MNKIRLLHRVFFVFFLILSQKALSVEPPPLSNTIEYTVYVYDANDKAPMNAASVYIVRDGVTIKFQASNAAGIATIRNIIPGKYMLYVTFLDYNNYSAQILIDKEHFIDSVGMTLNKGITTDTVSVIANRVTEEQPISLSNGVQTFNAQTYHAAPTSQLYNLMQEKVIGAVKAPTGEVHIRGMHGEFTYYLDGAPIPLGVFGGLNEVIDPKVIYRMTMLTGGEPAEYGGQMAGIMDIQTMVPSTDLHFDFSTYGGSFLVFNGTSPFSPGSEVSYGQSSSVPGDTLGGRVGPFRALNSNGQFLSASQRIESFGYYLSFSRQETDRRVDTPVPTLYNDHGTDYFAFGKFDYLLSPNDRLTANLNYSITHNQVPFDSLVQGFSPAGQMSYNSFQTLSYYHLISSEQNAGKDFNIAFFARQGGLNYAPSAVSPVNFQFAGDSTYYALSENRNFNTLGIRSVLNYRLSEEFKLGFGFNLGNTTGSEDFSSRDRLGKPGPEVKDNFTGSDFGIYAEEEFQPLDWFRLDAGIRYDQHIAPDVSMQTMFSPRIKFNFFIDEDNTLLLYYGKLFMPTNIEGLRLLASNITGSGIATLPEKDDMFEADYIHAFPFGLTMKAAAYYRYASPGLDDQTIGSSAVKTPVNIAQVHTTGLELGLSYSLPEKYLSAYLNTALNHAYGSGAITGGFLPIESDGSATDLDHDQRLTMVLGINYQPDDYFVNLNVNYGSGLTNGNPENITYQTGLFAFNSAAHVSPYFTINLGGGYTFHLGGEKTLEPSLYINNILDRSYIIKGAYFSGASWGEPRNVSLKLSLHI